MNEALEKCAKATDDDLRKELAFLIERERRNLAAVLAALGEYSYRRLYRDEGYYSMFEYCLRALKFDESSAYRHITAARVARQYPEALALISAGELTLTSILILSPVLTEENRMVMFKQARGKTRRELEAIVAGLSPLAPRMDYVQRVPTSPASWGPPEPNASTTGTPGVDPQQAGAFEIVAAQRPREWQAVMPVSLDRVRIGFDAAVGLMTLVDRARQVLRHKHPEGRLEDVLTEALEVFLDRKDPQKRLGLKPGEAGKALASQPRLEPRFLTSWRGGRYIAARVKRAVWQRDDGRCVWRFDDGTLCGSREALEFDHFRPFAKGGRSDDARNVRLLCRLHNGMVARAAGLSLEGRSAG